MYTELRHETLTNHLKEAVREMAGHVCGSARRMEIMWRKHTCTAEWSVLPHSDVSYDGGPSEFMTYRERDFEALMHFAIDNAYVEQGGELLRQKVGIPMGRLVAVRMANLYCYVAERNYVDGLAASGRMEQAKEVKS